MMMAKGSTLLSTLDFVAREAGAEVRDRVLARLGDRERARVTECSPTDEFPLGVAVELWRAVEAELGAADPTWIERAGAHSIESVGVQLYGGILKKASPQEFLTQGISLFQLYYHPGNMEVVEQGAGRAVLRLVGVGEAERDPLFCRRQTGGLPRALVLAGAQQARARHVRCAHEGDAYCEWELTW